MHKYNDISHESAKKHVTGTALYIDDLCCSENCLHAYIHLSSITKGKIKSISLDEVRLQEGVVDCITINDFPGKTDIGYIYPGDPILADKNVLFNGQAIFAVAATTPDFAYEASMKGHISYYQSKPTLTIQDAINNHQYVRPSYKLSNGKINDAVINNLKSISGSIDVGGQEHVYLETQISIALPKEGGGVHILCATQHPASVQKKVALALNIPMNKVTIEVRRIGGGFGGKESNATQWACIAALLAMRNGQAVKLRLTRKDDILLTGKRHNFLNNYNASYDSNGIIRSISYELNAMCGCSPDLSEQIMDFALLHIDNAYYFEEFEGVGHHLFTNTVSNTAFRGFGCPEGVIVTESLIERIARELDVDPLIIRKRNLYRLQKDKTPYGQKVDYKVLNRVVNELEISSNYWKRRQSIKEFNKENVFFKKGISLVPIKYGVAYTEKFLNQGCANINIYEDGSIQVNHGGVEIGQGIHTAICKIVACELCIPLEKVEVTSTSTDKIANASATAASTATLINGEAAKIAANILKSRLIKVAADLFNCEVNKVSLSNGLFRNLISNQALSFESIITESYLRRVSLTSTGYYKMPEIDFDRQIGKGRAYYYYTYGAAVTEVVIDILTGESKVLSVDILQDVGKAINRGIVNGQIQGGFIQGMGWLTNEEIIFDNLGNLKTNSLATYKIPTIGDIPPRFNIELLSNIESDAIYHAKAVGESPLSLAISVPCAILDALSSICEYRKFIPLKYPATSQNVLSSINNAIKFKTDMDASHTRKQFSPHPV